ncbi:MAG: hypothetical protein WC845_02165 [Candidatus Staskawiczbacteria bacterium]|jgi:hypothetical protein
MSEKERYPQWIDEFAKSVHNSFSNMLPGNWGPIDLLEYTKHSNNAFFDKLYQAIEIIKKKGYPQEEIAKTFSCPSALRCAFLYMTWEYGFSDHSRKKEFNEIAEFFVDVLGHMMKEDIFCLNRNIFHNDQEIKDIFGSVPWSVADTQIARELGKLYTSCAALAFALYRDFFPQISHEVYGPYDASSKFGKDTILVIKHFPKLFPKEIWPSLEYKYGDIKIFQVFKNVKFRCELIGMHTVYEGDIMNGLVVYAVMAGGKFVGIEEIKNMSREIAEITTKQIQVYDSMPMEEIKKKTLEWECYQFFDFFQLAGMDWRPTIEMMDAVKNKKIGSRTIIETFPPLGEYMESVDHEIYWLKDLYK